ncbi:EAL domain-containing protein [Bacillus sp. FJAT-18017]|uniref:EAL domain-containing protein n=1 Tax=Bacillus sp. FJAT-18017 TaxID=1705566 RepID=UPI0006B01E6C|nr:EAL domain-containing protein [Bacillus sp. FJAT-18017]
MGNTSMENSANVHSKTTITDDRFYRSLFEENPDMIFFLDNLGVIAKMNDLFSETLGYTQKEMVLKPLKQFVSLNEIPHYKELIKKALTGEKQSAYTTLVHKNGQSVLILLTIIPVKSEEKVVGIFGIAKDITDIQESARVLAESELKFSSIVEEALAGIYIVSEDGNVSYGNKRFYEILGIAEGRTKVIFHDYVHPDDLSDLISLGKELINGESGRTHTFRIIRNDGAILDIESHSKKIYLQGKPFIVASLQDITERKKAAAMNEHLAHHDFLTGLPNIRLFYKKLEQELINRQTSRQPLTVMVLDLDRFKYVNDTPGHTIGNELLKKVAERLSLCIGNDGVLARMGGDEFVVLLPNTGDIDRVIEYAKTMIESLEQPFNIEQYELFITASIGISTFPQDGEDTETLMKHANSALYKAKEKGRNTYQIFNSAMNTEAYKLFMLESDLRKALELNQLELYYQPKLSAATHEIIGAEALIRWNHPEWGIVYPGEFIPIAEETGLILEIGKWVKETACSQNKTWQDAGLPAVPVSINLSAHRFLQKELLENIKETLAKTQLDPRYLQVEIVETSLLENEKVVFSMLDELRKMGIKVLMDDFGTGYSSLSSLKKFKGKIDTLKIDRSFINDLSRTDIDSSNFFTKTIIELAQHLEMDVVAEGVETVEQLEILKEYNCNMIQGYLFSKPVAADEFAALLKKGKIELHYSDKEKPAIEKKRKYPRVNLDFPLSASMALIRIHGRNVEIGKTKVLIQNIGLGGLRFLSNIRLPVHRDIILEFETEILGSTIKMVGSVVWMREMKSNIHQYGIEFSIDETERSVLAPLFEELAFHLRKNPLIPDGSFVTVDPYTFFKHV